MEPLQSKNGTASTAQRLLIGAGTLFVVILTVLGAIFLAMEDFPEEEQGTPQVQISPSPTFTRSLTEPAPTTAVPGAPTDTPDATSTTVPVATTPPPSTPTETPTLAATATTPAETETPTATFTVAAEEPAAQPAPTQPPASSNGVCEPPSTWVAYTVQVGDTLNVLAERTNTTVFDLQQINCLDSFTIRPNEVIYLPFTPPTPTPSNTPGPTSTRRPTPSRTPTAFAPRITSVVARGDTDAGRLLVFVTGENFRSREQGFRAELVGPSTIPLQIGEARTSTTFEAFAPLDAALSGGEYDLVVINPNGRFDVEEDVYPPSDETPTPTPAPPVITNVSPDSGRIEQDIRLTILGRNFRPLEAGFRVELQLDDGSLTVELIVDESVRAATESSFDALILANTLERGLYDLLVTNPNGQTDIDDVAYNAFE